MYEATMTEILINSNPVKNEFNANATINELIENLMNTHTKNTDVLTRVMIDGKYLSEAEEKIYFSHTLAQHQTIDLEVKTNLDLAFEALDSCNGYIDTMVDKINALSELYAANNTVEGNRKFAEVIDIIDLFVQLVSNITRTFRRSIGPKYVTSQTIQNLEIHLLSVMKAMLPAKEKNDIIMLCDLLEYELIDNLTQWKIKAIPELRKAKDQ
jgi:hypothetical protein